MKLLHKDIPLGASLEEIKEFAGILGIEHDPDALEREIALQIIDHVDTLTDPEWDELEENVQVFCNDINEVKNDPKYKEEKPKVKRTRVAGTEKPEDNTNLTESQALELCEDKDAVIKKAKEFAENMGIEITLKKVWGLKRLREEALKQLNPPPKEEKPTKPLKPSKPQQEAPNTEPEPTSEPKPNGGNNENDDPPPPEETAEPTKDLKPTKPTKASKPKLVKEDEDDDDSPYRKDTISWIVWDIMKNSDEELSIEDIQNKFSERIEELKRESENKDGAGGAAQRAIFDMMSKGIVKKNITYTLELS